MGVQNGSTQRVAGVSVEDFVSLVSMRQSLKLHPDSHCAAVTHIEVAIARPRADSLVVSYTVTGKISRIRFPPATAGGRSVDLWRHTCFEAFVRASTDTGYYELNFSPSGQWAAYQFSNYRDGMRLADGIGPLLIETQSSLETYTLRASLELDRFPPLPRDGLWRLGLSAVIEGTDGEISYWALVHPPGKPDFHHADGFAYEFSSTEHP